MNLTTSEHEHYDAAILSLESCLTMLHDQAMRASDAYLAFVDEMERKNQGADKGSGIQLSVSRKGNHLDIKWTGIKWYGPKAKRFSKWIAIPKNKEKQTYTLDKLKGFAQEWELDMVMLTEEKMTRIRRKASHVVKGIMSVRNAVRVANADGQAAVDFADGDEPQDD
jgi:hypothetical protein